MQLFEDLQCSISSALRSFFNRNFVWAMLLATTIVTVSAQEIELSVYFARWATFVLSTSLRQALLQIAEKWTAFPSLCLTSRQWMESATSTTCLLSLQLCRVWSLKPRQRLKWLTKPRKHANWYGQIIKVILSVFFRIYLYMCNMYITMKCI